MGKILGLDLGTNSIGWALLASERTTIDGIGDRIIPMSQDILGKFDSGNSFSQTAERTGYRGMRRIRERHLLRRERLHRVLHLLGFLPSHYEQQIDFKKNPGKFLPESEPKIAWKENSGEGYDFIFQESFLEMVEDIKKFQPHLFENNNLIPYDWTIYYLRKKALQSKIKKEELAWLLLNFNQKRGYYQLRGEEEEEKPDKRIEFHSLTVVEVTADEPQKGKTDIWYNLVLENGWVYRRSSKNPLFDWRGLTKDFIVTTELNEDGTTKTDKEGKERRSFRSPSDDDWTLLKKKTESDIEASKKTVGCYIYDALLQNPAQKINGKLVRAIERDFYRTELQAILEKQTEFHTELKNDSIFHACCEELYPYNEAHKIALASTDFPTLFINDIIFYQRPLKSKKSLISNCKFEYRTYKNDEGILCKAPLKCVPKSHPLYQELRLWKFVKDLKIYEREKTIEGKLYTDCDVTDQFIKNEDDLVNLFDWLSNREKIKQETLLSSYFKLRKQKGAETLPFRWNYVEDKEYPCNETHAQIVTRLAKLDDLHADFLTAALEMDLWHILYSITDKKELSKALKSFAGKNNLSDEFVSVFKKFPPFSNDYGSYSEKALKKLLPLMRTGKYWRFEAIDEKTKLRIEKIMAGEIDDTIKNKVREKAINLADPADFNGLPEWFASYVVYNRFAEASEYTKWKSFEDIDKYLLEFKQHSLRNPIVEQVITETLRVVRDIWKKYGEISEIHVELGREMKNPANKRASMAKQMVENENANLRIKALLAELANDSNIENVRPYSPSQQEILRIYEDGVINSGIDIPDEIDKISKSGQPTQTELIRYKLWLEQKYRSPYTGEMIPLGKLFTTDYQIEHIIPQSRYFDDSFSNKVICESVVNGNPYKDNQLGYEFIAGNEGRIVSELSTPKKTVKIFTTKEYEAFVKQHYGKNPAKMRKLLMEDIPEKFIERQLNDTRYISKIVKGLLSNIVREENETEAISKNVIPVTGAITDTLKRDWGLNDVWNRLITPRFERLNTLTNSNKFGQWENKDGKRVFRTQLPLELQKGFNKKRIDHRHHAMDALVIACATRNHVNYLNNEHARKKDEPIRYDLRNKLRRLEQIEVNRIENGITTRKKIMVAREFIKPWETFTEDAQKALENMVVSFKQNLRVINKTVNKFKSYKDETGNLNRDKSGNPIRKERKQVKGENWAIRKSLHTPMPYGKKVYNSAILTIADNVGKYSLISDSAIREQIKDILVKFSNKISETQKFLKKNPIEDEFGKPITCTAFKIETQKYRRRQPITKLSNRGQGGIKSVEDAINFINKVADCKLHQELLMHLALNGYDIDKAFSSEGIEIFNSKRKIPVYKLPIAESGSGRFAVGNKIGTRHKYVEADKGTNLFFAIYIDKNELRNFESIPLNEVIEHQKWRATLSKNERTATPMVPVSPKKGKLLFYLSPNDLVIVPDNGLYKMVSSSGNQCFFVPHHIASPIVQTTELGANNKSEKTWNGVMIKQVCHKIKVDRLGNISIVGEGSY